MKRLPLFLAVPTGFAFVASSRAALAQSGSSPTEMNPFSEKVLIALIAAGLSLLTGYLLFQAKERREKRRRLSYDLDVRPGLVAKDQNLPEAVRITYKGLPADKLTLVVSNIRNTGTTVVKNQLIRFRFGQHARVLDIFQEPPPPAEYGVTEVALQDPTPGERRFQIKHLERDCEVQFSFLVSGEIEGPLIVPFNEEGDVQFVPVSVSRTADDRRSVERFVGLSILLWALPPIAGMLPAFLGDSTRSFLRLILAAALLPHVRPFSQVVASRLLGSRGRAALIPRMTLAPEPSNSPPTEANLSLHHGLPGPIALPAPPGTSALPNQALQTDDQLGRSAPSPARR